MTSVQQPFDVFSLFAPTLNLAVWFGLHVVFEELQTVKPFGLDLDVPLWSSIHVAAAALVLAAHVAVFRCKLGPVTVLAGCAIAGAALHVVEAA